MNSIEPRHTGRPNEALIFFARHVMEPSEGCRLWLGEHDQDGYGRFVVGGKEIRVGILTCEVWYGPPQPRQHVAAHLCRNRNCWAGEHLRWATHRENVLDKLRDGTMLLGERHHKAKLNSDQVLDIRARFAVGDVSKSALAREYGVSLPSITAIIQRKTWAHI